MKHHGVGTTFSCVRGEGLFNMPRRSDGAIKRARTFECPNARPYGITLKEVLLGHSPTGPELIGLIAQGR